MIRIFGPRCRPSVVLGRAAVKHCPRAAQMSTATLVTGSVADLNEINALERFKRLTLGQRLQYIKGLITIEPILCCYIVADVVNSPAINNLCLEMACKADAGFNESVCEAVVSATHAERNFTVQNSVAQQHISDMLSWTIPVQSVVPVILLLFFGSFSDRHRMRKPFLVLPVLGEVVATLCCVACALFRHSWTVDAIGLASTISSFFGGSSLMLMATFAYIADVSTQEMRIVRMAVIQICLSVCLPVALAFSGMLFDAIGYVPSLLVGLSLYIVAFLDGIFVVKEPKQTAEKQSLKTMVVDIVNPRHALKTLKLVTDTKERDRTNIIFILVVVYINATVIGGEEYVLFYFTQHAYGWNYSQYTIFLAAWTIITSVGLVIGAMVMSRVFHLHDLVIITIAFLGKVMSNIVFIVVRTGWGLYLALLVGILQDAGSAGIRSQSTKYVSEDDIGKSQSLLSIVEAIAYALAAEVYHQGIYTYTRDTYIQAFFYVGVVLYTFGAVIVAWKYFSERKAPREGAEEKGEVKVSYPNDAFCIN